MRRPAAALAALLLVTACGSGEPDVAAPSPVPTLSPATTPSASPTPSPSTTPQPALDATSPIGVEGIGDVVAGMTVREAEELTGLEFLAEGFDDLDGRCWWAVPQGLEERVTFMVVADARPADPADGVIARATADQSMGDPAPTVSGIRVGDPASRVREVYGDRLTASPHTYQEDGEYLDVVPEDPALQGFLLRMEVGDSGVVEQVHGGTATYVRAPEGCS